MTTIHRNPAVRLLALLLAVVMLGGLFVVATNVKQYNH